MIKDKIYDKNILKEVTEKYLEWITSGAQSSEILVLTSDSNSKKNIIKNILNLAKINTLTDIKINTFRGLIYNTVSNNWADLENKIKNSKTLISPNLSGLEVSQYLLKQIIKEEEVKGYNSKKSLLHQIFRRFSLIANNNLSDEDIRKKSEILGETFSDDAGKIIKRFQAKTIDLRAFDYIRQSQIFKFVYKNSDYFKDIKYLILTDGDECTPLCLDFVETISKQLKDHLIILDKEGGTRCGYLCAEPEAVQQFETMFNEKLQTENYEQENITALKKNIIDGEKNPLKNVTVKSLSKRVEMVEKAVEDINELVLSGISPKEIAVITPVQDKMIKYSFRSGLKNSRPLFLSGSEKLANNPLVKAVLTMLKLTINKEIDEYELRVIFTKYMKIPVRSCRDIFDSYRETKVFPEIDLGDYSDNYKRFISILEKLKTNIPLSDKAYYIYTNFIRNVEKEDLNKFNFFLKELQDFEKVFKNEKPENFEEDIILQIENSIISENPYSTLDIADDNIVIATPQKIIDSKIKTKYQFWLDISSQEWIRPDIGPLYNSWVFQKSWDKEDYTVEDNIRLTKEKTYKILRKLILNSEKIICSASLFDTQGTENFGGIEGYLVPEYDTSDKQVTKGFKITPRDDQKPVLEYKSGRMAISAVPGAGKTTILLALIIKLMERGINPENIYVMTYMESAARNFKDRIKSINPDSTKLPNISTIHGLALRILKENSNYERLGLNSDFDICDDTQRGNIIRSLSAGIKKEDLEDFDRGISVLKLSGWDSENPEIQRLLSLTKGKPDEIKMANFLRFFFNYQEKLKQNNLIDYDDILISAVNLLENNKDILAHYQEICEYMIEDEAQDSSFVQQKLINLLSAKRNNLIRCGDINQAITTTFTNADVEGFKQFIETSQRVDMNCSQRCTEGVWRLANRLVKYGNSKLKDPFYEIYMNPVEGKNPVEKTPLFSKIYKTGYEEKTDTVRIIKSLLDKNPNSTIGILLRNNYQVNRWADYINSTGLTAITRNECLGQKKIFKVIFSILKFISEPYNNYIAGQAYKSLSEIGILKPHLYKIIEDFTEDFISQNNDEIVDSDLARFHWDMNYWLSFPELSVDELALMIGLNYFSETLERSNIYLISTLCAKLSSGTFNQTIQRLEELSLRPNLSGFKFFSEDEEEDMTGGKIQIMTLHKSKGDEFDYVFLPEMSERNLTLDISQLQIKKSSNFMENVRGLNKQYSKKSEPELKKFLINENYRLLYVAITRAKQRLYISAFSTEKYYGKNKETKPSIIFEDLL